MKGANANIPAFGRRSKQKGFSLLVMAATGGVMFGMVGLAFDLGRSFIVKNELQAFVDASAMAAVRQLDGSQLGIQGAHTTAAVGPLGTISPNKWNFDSTNVTNVTETYAATFGGTYDNYATASSNVTNRYRFVKVVANATLPFYFLPVIPGLPTSQVLQANAVGGQQALSGASNTTLEPFAPDAHNPADLQNFGLVPGQQYTLKWGNGNATTCAGDAGFTPLGAPPSAHGFVDLGQGNGNSSLGSAITYGSYPSTSTFAAGSALTSVPGNRGSSIFDALSARAAQDSDDTSTTYAAYLASGTGNGRRIITVPIGGTWSGHGSNASTTVLGFGNFLLDPIYSGSSGPICATYIGPGTFNGNSSGATDGTKVYTVNLFQ